MNCPRRNVTAFLAGARLGKRLSILTAPALSILALAWCLLSPPAGQAIVEDIPVLDRAEKAVQGTFARLDLDLAAAAEKLHRYNLRSTQAGQILQGLSSQVPYAASTSLLDNTGRILALEPAALKRSEGFHAGDEEMFRLVQETRKPVLSHAFFALEGFDAVAVGHPLFTSNLQHFKGALRVLLKPRDFLAPFLDPVVIQQRLHVWVIQTDGLVLYDPYDDRVGLNIFQDGFYKAFPEIDTLGKRFVAEAMGSGNGMFITLDAKSQARQHFFWSTLSLYGTSWRLIANR